MTPKLYLLEDAQSVRWAPLTFVCPAGELLFGAYAQRERWERWTGLTCSGYVGRDDLVGFEEEGAPPVVARNDFPRDELRIVLNSRAVPSWDTPRLSWEGLQRLMMKGRTIGWVLPPGVELPVGEESPSLAPDMEPESDAHLDGEVLEWPWTLVDRNAARLTDDLGRIGHGDGTFRLTGVHIVGDHPVFVAPDARVDPGVILDARPGPIRLTAGVRVSGPARLTGPVQLGLDTTVFGGRIEATTTGPRCKLHGEISHSVIAGFSNKAHDGYIGHSYLGRWVNLGAMTTTSDLKNNYSTVRVATPEGEIDTGEMKLGTLFGDHVKTGIGTLLNTGTRLGCGSNVFGGAMPPKLVGPFLWGSGSDLVPYRLDRFLQVAEIVMGRRDQTLSESMRELLTRAWERAHGERG